MEHFEVSKPTRFLNVGKLNPGDSVIIIRKHEWDGFVRTLASAGLLVAFAPVEESKDADPKEEN